jgi:AraC-like DNA-binding protein
MSAELGLCRVALERVDLPPMTSSATFYWDGMSAVSQCKELRTGPEPDHPDRQFAPSLRDASSRTQCQTSVGQLPGLSLASGNMVCTPSLPLQAIDWEREAAGLTFYVEPRLLMATAHHLMPGATGELVWVYRKEHAQSIVLYLHPLLIIHTGYESPHTNRIEIIPHFGSSDPLFHHIILVLKAEIEAESMATRLYAELLTNALAVHLLRRYATCKPPTGACISGLSKPKLHRIAAYIEAQLAHELSLIELATVAQMSADHFARLFRQATGRTPHQYVIMCRIERAKQLLVETELPILDIAHQVGFTDQSYFTAIFRKHVNTTPKHYRDDAKR